MLPFHQERQHSGEAMVFMHGKSGERSFLGKIDLFDGIERGWFINDCKGSLRRIVKGHLFLR